MKTSMMVLFLQIFCSALLFSQETAFTGKWKLIKEKSSDIDYYQYLTLDFSIKKDEVTIIWEFGPRKKYVEKMILTTNGKISKVEINDWVFPMNVFMGYKMPVGRKKEVSANWENNNVLKIIENYEVIGSQGLRPIKVIHSFELDYGQNIMIYKIQRNTRIYGPEVKYILKRADFNNAYVFKMTDNWEIDSKLPEQACLISLQGIVNEKKSNLYFIYGEKWDFNFTKPIFDFLKNQHYFTFTQLSSLEQAVNIFKENIKGYIIWDKKARTSLGVAYTVAGLEKGIVITEEFIPLMQKYGLKQIEDFRGRFNGKTDYEIYSWAYNEYWKKCSKDYIVWLGGEYGAVMKPGIADFGITQKTFFTDLSCRISDTLEFSLTNKLFSEMNPLGIFMGWHSYKKDWEEESVTVTSTHALRVEPLNTLPNISFMNKIPVSPGFKFKNNHNLKPDQTYIPEKKVYISFIQSDMLGLGAWDKPGRGSIPYAWELNMNWIWLAPAMLEYHYLDSTPNDYFIGCLSGPGYLYPNAVPKKWLKKMLEMTKELMSQVDLNSFEIMDYSTDRMDAGISELKKDVVDLYYEAIPNSIGFVNGYYTSFTYSSRNKRPFVSYDYYLSPARPVDAATADLKELAKFNADRPYFLLVHVRQSSDVSRVKSITDKLGPEFELVPLDVYLKLSGENPTFKERYLDDKK